MNTENNILEEKGRLLHALPIKIIIISVILFFSIQNIKHFTSSPLISSIDLLFTFFSVLLCIAYTFYAYPYKIIITNDLLIGERRFFNNLVIPLKNISEIKEVVRLPYVIPDYYIKYDYKHLWLFSRYYRFKGKGFDKFINELKQRINTQKLI